jgi:hypothetical protein
MSLFGKQSDRQAAPAPAHDVYRITDLIQLLKTMPIEEHPNLVLQVIKTTLESVGVHSSTLIDDANLREEAIREHIGVLDGEIIAFTHEVQTRRDYIAYLNAELAETIDAKSRLSSVEEADHPVLIDLSQPQLAESTDPAADVRRALPPPLPPPRRVNGDGRALTNR